MGTDIQMIAERKEVSGWVMLNAIEPNPEYGHEESHPDEPEYMPTVFDIARNHDLFDLLAGIREYSDRTISNRADFQTT